MARTCRPADPSVLDGAIEQVHQEDDELGNERRHVRQALLTLESKSIRLSGVTGEYGRSFRVLSAVMVDR